MGLRNLLCLAVALIAVLAVRDVDAQDSSKDIFVSDAWVQAMPPSQTTTAAYMTIANNSQKEMILSSASSDIAAATEIHQMSMANGMMNMTMVANVHIPALGKVTLQPGGYHIMLVNLKKPVNKGDTVALTLHFSDGSAVVVNAQAKMPKQADEPSASMPGMKM